MRTCFLAILVAGCNLTYEEGAIDERFAPSDALTLSAFNWSLWNDETLRTVTQPFDGYCRFTVTGDGRVATFERTIDPATGTLHFQGGPGELHYYFELDDSGRIVKERRALNGRDVLRREVERDAGGALSSVATFNSFEEAERIRFRDGVIVEYTDAPGVRWSYDYDAGVLSAVEYFDDGKLIQLDEYTYGAAGELVAIDETRRTSGGSWTFGYPDEYRIVAMHVRTDGLSETVTLDRDHAGRLIRQDRTQHRKPDQRTLLESTFDARGRITSSVVDGLLGRTLRQYAYVCQ